MADSVAAADPERLEKLLLEGGEFLKQNRVKEAREMFAQALSISPNNTRALGLLGLVCFRMNDFESAWPVYEHLVSINRTDASLALNLGLVYLKLGKAAQAIKELQRCRELDPSQTRAVSYLGLAYARNGAYADAFQAFLQAGDEDLAREMEQYLTGEQRQQIRSAVASPKPVPTAPPIPVPNATADVTAAPENVAPESTSPKQLTGEQVVEFSPAVTVELSSDELEVIEEEEDIEEEDRPVEPPAVPKPPPAAPTRARANGPGVISQAVALVKPSSAANAGVVRLAVGHSAPQPLFEFATEKLIRPDDGDHPFELSPGGVLIIRVNGRVFTRTEGVNVTGGELAYEVASRRVRGASSGEDFSGDGRHLFVVSGKGHLVVLPLSQHFTSVILDEDILYLREDLVFAFEEQLRWENGRVPGSKSTISMVQFRGQGAVTFRSKRPLLSIKLAPEKVLHVDAAVLAGWIGRVIPRAVTPAAGGDQSTLFVECMGEGVILVEDESGNSAGDVSSDTSRPVLAGAKWIGSTQTT